MPSLQQPERELTAFEYSYHIAEGLIYREGDTLPPIQVPALDPGVEAWVSFPLDTGEHPLVATDDKQRFLRTEQVKVLVRFERGRWTKSDVHDEPQQIAQTALRQFLNVARGRTGRYLIDLNADRKEYSADCIDVAGHILDTVHLVTGRVSADRDQIDSSSWALIAQDCRDRRQTPLYLQLLLDARLYASREDFRIAVLNAGMSLEVLVPDLLRRFLRGLPNNKQTRTEHLMGQLSAAPAFQLLAVLVPKVPDDVVRACLQCRTMRDQVVHGTLSQPGRNEATAAIRAVADLLSVREIAALL